jgi:hypothetical protein
MKRPYGLVAGGYGLAILVLLALSCGLLSTVSRTGVCGSGGTVLVADATGTAAGLALLAAGWIATAVIMSRRVRRGADPDPGSAVLRGLGIGLLAGLVVGFVALVPAELGHAVQCFS